MKIPQSFFVRQQKIAQSIILTDRFDKIKFIGGADVAFGKKYACGALVVLSFSELKLVEQAVSRTRITLPYIPGFLSFREEPAIVKAFNKLKIKPEIILFDGQGLAHPRRAGLACALGVLLGIPTIGCAKTRLIGEYSSLGKKKGSASPLIYQKEVIGYVLRTKDNTNPIFVSPGHKVSIETAKKIALACCTKYRIPEPLRFAHTLSILSKRLLNHRLTQIDTDSKTTESN